jgi:hypothetical protein
MRFEIQNDKIQEFDIAFRRLVKWPVYTLYKAQTKADSQTFELVRNWDNKEIMQNELESREFTNMMGMVKVLGKLLQSDIYDVTSQENLLEMTN